ncbi:hypothetical protein [Pollutibacter soli]|uniref:hypothetical protein n=1 Tax=Pollutibacter soli TaxID=3034157 RepID=UPI0030141D83
MQKFLIIFLLSGSIFAFPSCRTPFQHLSATADSSFTALEEFRPAFGVGFYKTEVDVTGRHLSGILVIKKMPDSSMRVVFTNEAGPVYFDFSWTAVGEFIVESIMAQLNKKSVIKTLKKDFELILMNRLVQGKYEIRESETQRWFIFSRPKGYDVYLTNKSSTTLELMKRMGKRKPVVKATMVPDVDGIPSSFTIEHQQFQFKIQLNKMKRDVIE